MSLSIFYKTASRIAGAIAVIGLALTASPSQAQTVMKFATLTINDMQHEYIKWYKALYSTLYRKAKERMAFTGSFGDKSWSRNSII